MADTTSASLATVSTSSSALAALAPLVEAARAYVAAAQSDATRKAYRASWVAFTTWASSNGLVAMPATPETVALYVASLANEGRKAATIDKALVAISGAHRAAGVEAQLLRALEDGAGGDADACGQLAGGRAAVLGAHQRIVVWRPGVAGA